MEKRNPRSRATFSARLQEMVLDLRQQIADGDYKPGDYLPAETELVEKYNLSNKSVRKGLDQLLAEGWIVKINRVGSQVTNRAAETLTVTLGTYGTIERDFHLTALLEDFQALHPGLRVKTVRLSTVEYQGINRDYLQSGLVDALTINNMDFMCSEHSGSTRLLEPLTPDPGVYGFASEAFESEGLLLARPIVFSPVLLAYNREHFRQAGVPEPDGSWTWAEALKHASALTVPGERHGLYFHLLSDNRWPAFLLQSGLRFEPDAGGFVELHGTRLLESIRLCKRIITDPGVFPNYMSENSHDVNELFMQGKVSMILTNYMTLNEIKHSAIDYDISPLPYLYEPRSLMTVIGVAVNAAAKHKEAAKQLVDYLASTRAQAILRRDTLSLPARKRVAEAPADPAPEAMNRPARYYLFREIMASYRLHRELNFPLRTFALLRQQLKKYWAGILTEEELCEQVRGLWRDDLGE